MTEEEVRKSMKDALGQSAAQSIQDQVESNGQLYARAQKDAGVGAAEGAQRIASYEGAAGNRGPLTQTAGAILGAGAGDANRGLALRAAQSGQALRLQGELVRAQGREQEAQQAEEARQHRRAEALEKAETLAQYGDFSGYAEAGFSPEETGRMRQSWERENEGSYEGLGKYAQTLLNVYRSNGSFDIRGGLETALNQGLISEQDYQAALIAAAGIVGKQKAAKSTAGGSGSGTGSALEQKAQAAFARATQESDGRYRVAHEADLETLRAYYAGMGKNADEYFYLPERSGRADKSVGNRNGEDWVQVDGFGRVSWEQLAQLVRQNRVQEVKQGNTVVYIAGRRTT